MNGIVYDKICLMVPTYGRVKTSLPTFIQSAINTVAEAWRVSFCFCVNEKDIETLEFLKDFDFKGHGHEVITEATTSPNLAAYFNLMYAKTKTRRDPGTLVSMVGDDMAFETQGWETAILNLVNHYKGIGVFWCNDGYLAQERCAVNLFVARDFVEATGHPFMAAFESEMIDVVWTMVGHHTKSSHYLPNVMIRHNHNTKMPKEKWDATFKRLYAGQIKIHAEGGKRRAKDIGRKIADVLISKGLTGNSIC